MNRRAVAQVEPFGKCCLRHMLFFSQLTDKLSGFFCGHHSTILRNTKVVPQARTVLS